VRRRVRSWPAGLAVMGGEMRVVASMRSAVESARSTQAAPACSPRVLVSRLWAGVVEEARARRVGVAGTERFACLAPRLACGATAPTGFKLMRAGRVRRAVVAVGETKLARPHQRRGFRRVLKRGGAREVEQPERAVVQRRVRCCSVVLVGHDPRAERVAEALWWRRPSRGRSCPRCRCRSRRCPACCACCSRRPAAPVVVRGLQVVDCVRPELAGVVRAICDGEGQWSWAGSVLAACTCTPTCSAAARARGHLPRAFGSGERARAACAALQRRVARDTLAG
jgi:hypothetical protein